MSKISVIIPIYNVEKYLKECLESVVNQTLQDIEIICVNDGSIDNSANILDDYAKNDKRIKLISKNNAGYGSAMNIGLKNATGQYIGIVEPDDFIDINMYSDLYNIAINNNSDIVKSGFYYNIDVLTKQKIEKINWDKDKIPENRSFTIYECPIFLSYHPSIWSCIYNRSFLNELNIKFKEVSGGGWTDNLFQVQTMCLAEKINYTSKAYYFYRKTYLKDSDSLNDINIPINRSIEIHSWLQTNNICNQNILTCLYLRELGYANLILYKMNIKNFQAGSKIIKKLLNIQDFNVISNNPYFSIPYRKLYKKLSKNLHICFIKICLKNFLKKLIYKIKGKVSLNTI